MMNEINIPVLIVGAGPVGLALALDLGWRGIDCLIIDQSDLDVVLPRASGLTSRTMEFCRRWNLTDDLANCGFPLDYPLDIVYCTSLGGHEIERDPFSSIRDRPAPHYSPEPRFRCPQKMFDPILERALDRYPTVNLRRRHRLEGFEQDDEGVTAFVRPLEESRIHDFSGDDVGANALRATTDAGTIRVRARYMVACDGVDSPVRNALGIGLDGTPVLNYALSVFFKSPALHKRTRLGAAERYMLIGKEGIWGNLTVVDGSDEWRLSLMGSKKRFDLASLDCEAYVRRCLGDDTIPFEIISAAPWRRREVVATELRRGRIFLAGDAAHAMSPTGGLGMNAGLADVVDLGWKLEAILRGWGGEVLMDSYTPERKPANERYVKAATALFVPWILDLDYSLMEDDTPKGEAARREIGRILKSALSPSWNTDGTSMGYRYDDSPIIVQDGSAPPPDDPVVYTQSARPGARAPHAWLADGRSTLDLFGRGFVLLRFDTTLDITPFTTGAAIRGLPLTVETLEIPAIATLYEQPLVLVRPDGHVAWRGAAVPEAPLAIIDIVRGA
ncbi:MAG: FAD-dependent oxidoreductase [Zavarzinia sp.]|nr:FAD-dependent oxidoreductase [Zavarzinia sp.]